MLASVSRCPHFGWRRGDGAPMRWRRRHRSTLEDHGPSPRARPQRRRRRPAGRRRSASRRKPGAQAWRQASTLDGRGRWPVASGDVADTADDGREPTTWERSVMPRLRAVGGRRTAAPPCCTGWPASARVARRSPSARRQRAGSTGDRPPRGRRRRRSSRRLVQRDASPTRSSTWRRPCRNAGSVTALDERASRHRRSLDDVRDRYASWRREAVGTCAPCSRCCCATARMRPARSPSSSGDSGMRSTTRGSLRCGGRRRSPARRPARSASTGSSPSGRWWSREMDARGTPGSTTSSETVGATPRPPRTDCSRCGSPGTS